MYRACIENKAAGPEPSRPVFSIVTVCYNALEALPISLESLRRQDFDDYEWVVIDGASNDGTLKWLIDRAPDVLISESDSGIYDAMNRALRVARGDWIYFLNAGDQLASPRVLTEVASFVRGRPQCELVYGDVVYVGANGRSLRRFNWVTRRKLIYGDLCHQAVFARNSLFHRCGVFDDTLRFNADFDWFVRVFRGGAEIGYLAHVVALFEDSGAHVQAAHASEYERQRVRRRYRSVPIWILGNLLLRLEFKFRSFIGMPVR